MFEILKNYQYRQLLMAQIVALLGTGLATVALGLLALDLEETQASWILGLILMIKMLAYVFVAPIASALTSRWPRRMVLVSLDLVRAVVVGILPFATEVWQVLILIFLLQAASAGFTPTFQATIPDILPDEDDYTNALSLSRLVYDLESLVSPALAAIFLLFMSFQWLFMGTVVGFLASALLVLSVTLPEVVKVEQGRFQDRVLKGMKIYLLTPRLRGLLALCLTVAAVGSMVFVNTAVLVKQQLGLTETDVALALACFGAGSMLMAFVLPKVIQRSGDRFLMFIGSAGLGLGLGAFAWFSSQSGLSFQALLVTWFVIGACYSVVMTPSGRLLQRSAHPEDRPALYAAQFALSHLCWLICYPLAGFLLAHYSLLTTMTTLTGLAVFGSICAWFVWPSEQVVVDHDHADLPADHPHMLQHHKAVGEQEKKTRHAHAFVIDEFHHAWPDMRVTSA